MMMDSKGAPGGTVRLYHGSDVPIKHPDTAHNTGFADLGPGFYLTDDHDAAWRRARSRARREGAAAGVVSAFAFDETALRWATWGEGNPQIDGHAAGEPFGLRFEESGSGIVAWARYIDACRRGRTAGTGLGEPAVVRGWIATEEVEMACAGMVEPEELAEALDPQELVVQYCLLSQDVIERALSYLDAEQVPV